MSIRNPGSYTPPATVMTLAAALEKKLGRPSYVRQVKNRSEWFVTDPMFSFVQHGLRKGATGYRVGYYYSADEDDLAFYLLHSPIMAQLFKKNLRLTSLIHVATETAFVRSRSFLLWSSRSARRHGEKWALLEEASVEDFVSALHQIDNDHCSVSSQMAQRASERWASSRGMMNANLEDQR